MCDGAWKHFTSMKVRSPTSRAASRLMNAMFVVVLTSGLVQLLVWNFVSDYPGIISALTKIWTV